MGEFGLLEGLIVGAIIGVFFTLMITSLTGGFNSLAEELDLDEDDLVSEYVKSYYPEYKDCNINYVRDLFSNCISCPVQPGVEVFCNHLDNRDGLRQSTKSTKPTIVLEFKAITLKEIIQLKLDKGKL